jgi:hypothetical protein
LTILAFSTADVMTVDELKPRLLVTERGEAIGWMKLFLPRGPRGIFGSGATAAHKNPRTTKLHDRAGDEITLDEV